MTLIINEIRFSDKLGEPYWISAADRRLSSNGKFHSTRRRKIFPVKYLNATISFFGLAVWEIGHKEVYLSDIIKNQITKLNNINDLSLFSEKIVRRLNEKIPRNLLQSYPTGIHISGFQKNGVPQFFYSSNIGKGVGWDYHNLRSELSIPSEELYDKLKTNYNWDGVSLECLNNKGYLFRNGDIKSHVISSEKLDYILSEIIQTGGFREIANYDAHADFLMFKLNFIASLYKHWSNTESIGTPIDLYILFKNKILEKKNNIWRKAT